MSREHILAAEIRPARRRGAERREPQDVPWNRRLLTDMTLEVPGLRPALIDASLAEELGEFLRFRHVFRNSYGWSLRDDRMRDLEDRLPALKDKVREPDSRLPSLVGRDLTKS